MYFLVIFSCTVCICIETSQWTGFYTITVSVMKGLITSSVHSNGKCFIENIICSFFKILNCFQHQVTVLLFYLYIIYICSICNVGWEPKQEWFWPFEHFSKLKTAFSEYWPSTKIKISMTCISKEYEIMELKQKWCMSNDYS